MKAEAEEATAPESPGSDDKLDRYLEESNDTSP